MGRRPIRRLRGAGGLRAAAATLVAVATALVLAPQATAAMATACDTPWGSLAKTGEPYASLGSLTDLRSGRHACYDRLVIDLAGRGPSSYDVGYVDQVTAPGSGRVVPLRGGADIQVVLQSPAYDVDTGQPTYHPADADEAVDVSGYDTFRQVALAGSFEAQTVIGLGVRARLPMRVFSLAGPGSGSRLVIDVAHVWPPEPALPGDPAETMFPLGTQLAVTGVEADDVLNVRELPGAGQPIVTTLDPLETAVFYAGQARHVGGGLWYQVDHGNYSGWANARYLTLRAGTYDLTSEVLAAHGGPITGAEVSAIGDVVVETRIEGIDTTYLQVRVVDGPHQGDLHEITYDITNFADDSVFGERVHVFAAPADDGSGLLGLKSVEVTYLCWRGGDPNGLCV